MIAMFYSEWHTTLFMLDWQSSVSSAKTPKKRQSEAERERNDHGILLTLATELAVRWDDSDEIILSDLRLFSPILSKFSFNWTMWFLFF